MSKGLEQSRAEVRARKGYALALAVNPRGPDHLCSQVYAEDGATPEARALDQEDLRERRIRQSCHAGKERGDCPLA